MTYSDEGEPMEVLIIFTSKYFNMNDYEYAYEFE